MSVATRRVTKVVRWWAVSSLLGLALVGCDPSAVDVFTVTIKNDTPSSVVIEYCGSDCSTVYYTNTVAPEGSLAENTSTENLDEYIRTKDYSSGKVLGCLNLKFRAVPTNLTIRVSTTGKCPTR
jgi:hypothetical protein